MSWFKNIKIIKESQENKVVFKLTAEIEDVFGRVSSWHIEDLVKRQLVEYVANSLRHRYVEDLAKSIDMETIRKQALEAFKDDIRDRFTKDRK